VHLQFLIENFTVKVVYTGT